MKVAAYEAAHRAANTPEKRAWLRAEALRRDEGSEELSGLLRSTYPPGYLEDVEALRRLPAAATAPPAAELEVALSETGDFG